MEKINCLESLLIWLGGHSKACCTVIMFSVVQIFFISKLIDTVFYTFLMFLFSICSATCTSFID